MNNVKKGVKGFMRLDPEARFWDRVDKAPGHGPNGDCWLWTGSTDGRYGQIWREGRRIRAHRFSWEIANGPPFPADKDACHACDNPPCVNPAHIFPGSPTDNAKDAVKKRRVVVPSLTGWRGINADKTHCIRGHEFTPENTILQASGRKCRACQRDHQARYDAKRRGYGRAYEGQ